MTRNFYSQSVQRPSINPQLSRFQPVSRSMLVLMFMFFSIVGFAQQSYTSGTYSQNFNGLPTTGTFTVTGAGPFDFTAAPFNIPTMTGWQFAKIAGSGTNAIFLLGNNTTATTGGAAYSYGSTSAPSDRALGSLASGAITSAVGLVLTNNSGTAIGSFTISFRGEQWRNGGSNTVNTLAFGYKFGGNILGGTFTGEPSLDFSSLKTSSTSAQLDGNASGNFTTITATVSNIVWANGTTLVLRWADTDNSGSDDALAIDDLTFSGTPAPPTITTNTASFNSLFGSVFVGSSSASSTFSVSGNNLIDDITITPPAGFEIKTGANAFSTAAIVLTQSGGTVTTTNIDVRFTPTSAIAYNGNISCTSSGATSQFIPVSGTGLASDFPTKLAITSVNGGVDAEATYPFSVIVQAQDNSNVPQFVTANTNVTLSLNTGGGTLGGTLSGTILAGTNSVTISGVTYSQEESGVIITATRTAGDALTAGNSAPFNVLAKAAGLKFVGVPGTGIINTNLTTFTVEARRDDNSVDNLFTDNVTLSLFSGSGNLSGTLVKQAVAGVATFSDIQLDAAGSYILEATAPGVSLDLSNNLFITQQAVFTELVVPLYFGSKTASATNNARTPFAVCFRIDNLVPSTSYDLKVGLGLTSDAATSYGAGNNWNQTIFNANTLANYFTTDASGSSGPVWVYIEPTGNGTRFDAGQVHNLRVGYAINGNFTPSAPNFVGTKLMTALDIATTARTVATTDDGAFLKGSANACVSGKYILIYDNTAGTGDPLFSYMSRTAVPTQPSQPDLPVAINDIYSQSGTSAVGDFPAVIPIGANNPNGVRRIEARNADNTMASFATDGDGNWNAGGNTITITRRSVATISNSSASLHTITVSASATDVSCNGGNNGSATAIAVSSANPVSYSWNSTPVQTGSTATGLTVGNYTVVATDNNTCTATANTTVNQPTPLVVTATQDAPIPCVGCSTTVTVAASGGTPGYTGTGTFTVPAGTYIYTVSDANGCSASDTITLTDPVNTNPTLDLTMYFQGYYIPGSGGLMNPVLFFEGVDPNPLSTSVDTVTVELHSSGSPYGVVATYKGVLQTNGHLLCTFPAFTADAAYYIAIKYKNTLETWSAAPHTMTSSSSYSFASGIGQAYPDVNNVFPQMYEVEPGIWAIYSGDVNQDQTIDGGDFNDTELDVTGQAFGYYVTDITGDGPVDGGDFNLLELNVAFSLFVSHPVP